MLSTTRWLHYQLITRTRPFLCTLLSVLGSVSDIIVNNVQVEFPTHHTNLEMSHASGSPGIAAHSH